MLHNGLYYHLQILSSAYLTCLEILVNACNLYTLVYSIPKSPCLTLITGWYDQSLLNNLILYALQITGQSCPLSFKGSPYWMAPEVRLIETFIFMTSQLAV